MFLWTSTQWGDSAPVPYTDMLDVIKDTGFYGFRFVGWPGSLDKYNLTLPFVDRELSKRNLRIATLSFNGEAHDPSKHAAIDKSAHAACTFLNISERPRLSSSRRGGRTRCLCGSICA